MIGLSFSAKALAPSTISGAIVLAMWPISRATVTNRAASAWACLMMRSPGTHSLRCTNPSTPFWIMPMTGPIFSANALALFTTSSAIVLAIRPISLATMTISSANDATAPASPVPLPS